MISILYDATVDRMLRCYTHVAKKQLKKIKSPLDNIDFTDQNNNENTKHIPP